MLNQKFQSRYRDRFECLHIGCGLNTPENWLNVDASPSLRISKIPMVGSLLSKLFNWPKWPPNAKYGNIVQGLASVEKESCDLIFTAHVLEHLSLDDFHAALDKTSWYLKSGGFLRVVVPNLEYFIEAYALAKTDQNSQAQASIHFMQNTLLGVKASRTHYSSRFKEAFSNSKHQWMWDQQSLITAIEQHSFSIVRPCVYGDWSDDRFSEVERKHDYRCAIGVEAQK